MLYFFLVWVILIVATSIIGTALLNLWNITSFQYTKDRIIVAVWLGIVVISIALLTVSLVFPLSPLTGGVLILGFVALSISSATTRTEVNRLRLQLSLKTIIKISALALIIASTTARPITWLDTGLYHAGAIRWMAEYAAVPGVGLIHDRFGWTTSWFAFNAPLNLRTFDYRTIAISNGFCLFGATLHFFWSLNQVFKKRGRLSDWFVIVFNCFVLPLLFLRDFPVVGGQSVMAEILISPSPDISVLLLTGVIAWAILVVSEQASWPGGKASSDSDDARIIPLVLSAGVVTMKLTAIPVLLGAALFYGFGNYLRFKRLLQSGAIVVALLAPMFIYGIVTAGCPLSPSEFMCLNLPWTAVELETGTPTAQLVVNWEVLGEPPTGVNYWPWILLQWIREERINLALAGLNGAAILAGLYLLYLSYKNKQARKKFAGVVWLLVISLVGIVFIFKQAPITRYGLAYFLLIPAIVFAIYGAWLWERMQPELGVWVSHLVVVRWWRQKPWVTPCLLSGLAVVICWQGQAQSRFLLPPELLEVPLIKAQVNDVEYVYPADGSVPLSLCWASPLPCALGPIEKDIRLRNPARGIGAGFMQVTD